MSFRKLVADIKADLGNDKDKLFLKFLKSIAFSNSFKLILNYRIGAFCKERGFNLICKILMHRQIKRFSCQISYGARIGFNLTFPHPIGIVIGEGVIIGNNVKIWQNVTLGGKRKKDNTIIYPEISDNVKIFGGSMIIGEMKIGSNSTIGAMSLVLNDVRENEVVAGIPARVVS